MHPALVAIVTAQNYRTLRARGVTVRKTIGALISTYCINRGHVLFHSTRDFEGFERHLDLRVESMSILLPADASDLQPRFMVNAT